MKKYSFHSTEILIAIFVSLLVSSQTLASSDESASPNIVMILVDDAGLMDFAPFGGEAHMPNIQRLADQGVRFSNFYNCARCWASRAALISGYYPQQMNADPPDRKTIRRLSRV